MDTLVVYESMFGNTRMIAEAVADALRSTGDVTVATAAEAPVQLSGYGLVVVGAPTHAHTLPQPSSRQEAAAWADDPDRDLTLEADAMEPGIREWLDLMTLSAAEPRFAAFSTRADIPRIFAGDATASIRRRLHRRDLALDAHEDFLVDHDSHLLRGEQQRARDWALTLVPVTSRRE
ncbi:flavodoxin family protein [Arthrobacter sp. L77]|uniref:flavodoxin family protein n=1 Tax=Arthrobacter sp. L77 TaxID=1496689 RepID=UPI0005B8DE42|nr:flavodoxin domain-containing protein [Arthrobacter sp. L77]